MNQRIDRGEEIARELGDLIKVHEVWDLAQFTREAAPEWQDFTQQLIRLNKKVLDFPLQKEFS